jgi:hypothetical protein
MIFNNPQEFVRVSRRLARPAGTAAAVLAAPVKNIADLRYELMERRR